MACACKKIYDVIDEISENPTNLSNDYNIFSKVETLIIRIIALIAMIIISPLLFIYFFIKKILNKPTLLRVDKVIKNVIK